MRTVRFKSQIFYVVEKMSRVAPAMTPTSSGRRLLHSYSGGQYICQKLANDSTPPNSTRCCPTAALKTRTLHLTHRCEWPGTRGRRGQQFERVSHEDRGLTRRTISKTQTKQQQQNPQLLSLSPRKVHFINKKLKVKNLQKKRKVGKSEREKERKRGAANANSSNNNNTTGLEPRLLNTSVRLCARVKQRGIRNRHQQMKYHFDRWRRRLAAIDSQLQ